MATQALAGGSFGDELTASPSAVSVSAATKSSATALHKLARPRTSTTLDRVSFAVDGAESSHGADPAMWRSSPSGPQGPMQVSAGAATDVGGGNRLDPLENRVIGRAYLAALYARYKDWPDAIAAYNWGLGSVDAWIKAGRPIQKLIAGVATYTMRVLRDSGLCDGPAIATPFTHPLLAHSEADGGASADNRGYICTILPSSSFEAQPLRPKHGVVLSSSLFEQKAEFARSSWRTLMRRLGCTRTSANSLRCS